MYRSSCQAQGPETVDRQPSSLPRESFHQESGRICFHFAQLRIQQNQHLLDHSLDSRAAKYQTQKLQRRLQVAPTDFWF